MSQGLCVWTDGPTTKHKQSFGNGSRITQAGSHHIVHIILNSVLGGDRRWKGMEWNLTTLKKEGSRSGIGLLCFSLSGRSRSNNTTSQCQSQSQKELRKTKNTVVTLPHLHFFFRWSLSNMGRGGGGTVRYGIHPFPDGHERIKTTNKLTNKRRVGSGRT